jgi:hypothetical protein
VILDLKLAKDGNKITAGQSSYQPAGAERETIARVLADFSVSVQAKRKSYKEFNDMTLIQRWQLDKSRFNGYQEDQSSGPDDAWRSNAVRPITRNRAISIAAHVTASVIFPQVHAQNDRDEEDKDAAIVMRDLMEFAGDQSKYDMTFLFSVIEALMSPAAIIQTGYSEMYRIDRTDGEAKTVLDETLSGFSDQIVPLDEFFHPNFYEHDIQRQAHIERRRVIPYHLASAKYSAKYPKFQHVKPGVTHLFDADSEMFYEQNDTELEGNMVEELIYWNRAEDLMLTIINGVLICEPTCCNPRFDKNYPFAKFGFEPIDGGRFFYYRSLVNKLGPDEEVVQTLWRMIIDGKFLELMPPGIIYGDETVTSNVMVPGMITSFGPDTKFETINRHSNSDGGLGVLEKVEKSINESSIDPAQMGVQEKGNTTAYEMSVVEKNAKVMLGLFGKMISFGVKAFGDLRVSDILQYMTVADVMETTDMVGAVKYRSFIVPDRMSGDKKRTHKIKMDLGMFRGQDEITVGQKKDKEYELLKEAGDDTEIYLVNPQTFRRMKFLIRVTPELVSPPSDNMKKALNLEAFDRAINLPFIDQQNLAKDLLFGSYAATASDPDRYILKGGVMPMMGAGGPTQAPGNSATAMMANQRGQESAARLLKG